MWRTGNEISTSNRSNKHTDKWSDNLSGSLVHASIYRQTFIDGPLPLFRIGEDGCPWDLREGLLIQIRLNLTETIWNHYNQTTPHPTMCARCIWKPKRERRPTRIYVEPPVPTFTIDEVIECHGCHQPFPLICENGTPGIQIHCAGCDNFFHCKIAGTCYGVHCTETTTIGVMHHLSWCVDCVPIHPLNQEKSLRGSPCICAPCILVGRSDTG